ncbi:hypothetical protein L596_017423 [Steinernema carpocapsae]|uniref:Uncharacterized protein n=1 Tax=Steinernema carpocapsae TaxID=34508 RepID=A0A4U5N1M5_STECR|nr:hypothetical protein L596_017423 [Steinernema carpocapsae]
MTSAFMSPKFLKPLRKFAFSLTPMTQSSVGTVDSVKSIKFNKINQNWKGVAHYVAELCSNSSLSLCRPATGRWSNVK